MTNPPPLHALQIQSVLLSIITKQSIKTLLIVIASKAQALRGNPQIQKQTLFKPLLYDKTQPNPFQSLILRQNKTQPMLFAKSA